MSKADETIGFYRKMSDLQEKLRRSEEERLHLEEKFALLMRSCREEEEARLNDLRERYESFLEEEKQRRERNGRILQALDRIESRTAILTAKSERLRLLRRHYEAHMLKMYPGWKHVTNKFTDGQPSTPKFDPLNNKLSLEADRNKPYRGLESLSSLFPADYRRRVPFTSHHDHSAVCVIPPGHKPISISRTTIDTAPATTTVDGLPLPSIALPTDNVIDTQQKLPSCVVTVGQHSVSQKELPICTKETFNSSHNSTTGQLEYHKINELDDYLGRAAEMLKLSRAAENLSDTNLSQHFSEINPELKDTKHLGNSVDFELEQNTSGDILNVSLSDDGVLQEESNRTLLNFSQKGDQNKNISLTKQLNINVVNNNGEVLNKKAQLVENVNNKDILLNKNVQFLHHGSKPAYLEQQNQETVKGDAQNFKTALDSKGGGEFDSQQQLYQKNATLIRGGDPVIPDKSIYDGGTLFETEEQSGLSERKHQKSMLDDEVHNHGNNLDGQKQIEGFERSEQNPKESYVCEDNAVRQEKIDDTDESNAQGLMGNKCEETPANENICEAEGDQLDEQYKGEEPGDGQFTEQKQWNENDQQYYQQYAEQQGDEYYQYVEGERYQQHTEIEYDQQCDEHYVNQEGEQHYQQQYADQVEGQYDQQQYADQKGEQYDQQQYADQEGEQYDQQQYADQVEGQYDQQQYADQVEGQYDQKYGNQNVEQYNQQYVDQEGLQYNQQEGQCEQQAGQYEQQEGQHDQQNIDQQYMEYQTDQYDQQYEAYEQQKQKDNQLLPESQHVSEDNQTAQCEEDNQELGNQEDTKEECDQISELIQRQRLEVKGDNQESAGDVSHTSSFEDGKYQEQMKAYQATESGVGDGSQGGGMAGAKEEKTLSEVVDDKIYGISALPKQPDISSNLTEPSSSKHVEQYRQLLGETGEPEQSDTDELELQLAALVESQQIGEKHEKQLLQSVPTGEKMVKQTPAKVASPVVENIGDRITSTESSKNLKELANRTDIETSEVAGHEGTVHGNPEAQSKMPQTSSKSVNEPVAIPEEAHTVKTTQLSVPRPGSKKLPGLTKMLESDTESLQFDATMSNEDSDDFDFSSGR